MCNNFLAGSHCSFNWICVQHPVNCLVLPTSGAHGSLIGLLCVPAAGVQPVAVSSTQQPYLRLWGPSRPAAVAIQAHGAWLAAGAWLCQSLVLGSACCHDVCCTTFFWCSVKNPTLHFKLAVQQMHVCTVCAVCGTTYGFAELQVTCPPSSGYALIGKRKTKTSHSLCIDSYKNIGIGFY